MDNLQSDIQSVIKSIDILHAIAYSEASWEAKFCLIFRDVPLHDLEDAIERLNLPLDYTDPDESWEADTIAYIQALGEIREELALVLDAIEGIPE